MALHRGRWVPLGENGKADVKPQLGEAFHVVAIVASVTNYGAILNHIRMMEVSNVTESHTLDGVRVKARSWWRLSTLNSDVERSLQL